MSKLVEDRTRLGFNSFDLELEGDVYLSSPFDAEIVNGRTLVFTEVGVVMTVFEWTWPFLEEASLEGMGLTRGGPEDIGYLSVLFPGAPLIGLRRKRRLKKRKFAMLSFQKSSALFDVMLGAPGETAISTLASQFRMVPKCPYIGDDVRQSG